MFKENKYTKHYHLLMTKAQDRILPKETYKEKHHIVPKSIGGTDEKENLVYLTAREHFVAHWFLVKMTEGPDRAKMIYALNGMRAVNSFQDRYDKPITAKVYANYKQEAMRIHSETMKGRPAHNKGKKYEGEVLERMREGTRNRRKLSPDEKQAAIAKRVAKVIGQKRSEETKKKMSDAQKGKKKGPMSQEGKDTRSRALKGKKKHPGHGAAVAAANIGTVCINNGEINKKIHAENLQEWLDKGWVKGGLPRKTQGYVTINNGETTTKVPQEKAEALLNDGWVKGYCKK